MMLHRQEVQLAFNLDLAALEEPRARRRDPQTSHAAAADAKSLAKEHAVKILRALSYGPAGVDRIAARSGLTLAMVSKRMKELEMARAIRLTGREVKSDAGRAQREWTLA